MSFYLISESCGLQVRRFRNVLIGRHRNRMKPYEKQEQMFYHYSHSVIKSCTSIASRLRGVSASPYSPETGNFRARELNSI